MDHLSDDRLQLLRELESQITGRSCALPVRSCNHILHYREDVAFVGDE